MNPRRWLFAAVAVLSVSFVPSPAAQAPKAAPEADPAGMSAAQMLPADTFAFASVRSVEDLERACLSSPAGAKLCRMLGTLKPLVARRILDSDAAAEAGAFLKLARFLRRHADGELAFAVTAWKAEASWRPIPECAFLVRCRPGKAADAVRELKGVADGFGKRVKGMTLQDARHKETAFHRVGDREVKFAFGAVGNYLVAASSEAAFASVVDHADRARKDKLATHPAFWAARKRVGENADLLAYVSAAPVWKMAAVYEPKTDRKHAISRALGADGLEAVAYGLTASAGEFKETMYVYTPGGRTGIFQWLETAPSDVLPQDLALVPPDATGCTFGTLQLKKAWDSAMASVREIDGAFYAKKIEPGLKAAEQFLGMSIGDGILGAVEGEFVSFGGDWRVTSAMPGSAPTVLQETTFILKLKDEVRFKTLLGTALGYVRQYFPLPILDRKSGANSVSTMDFPTRDGTPFTVEWTIASGRFVLAVGSGRMDEVLGRLSGAAGPSLLDDPGFSASMKRLSRKGGYVQYESVGRVLAGLAEPLAVSAGSSADPALAALLDEFRRAGSEDLGALATTALYEPNGIAFEAVGPFPLSALVAAGAAAAVAIPEVLGPDGNGR